MPSAPRRSRLGLVVVALALLAAPAAAQLSLPKGKKKTTPSAKGGETERPVSKPDPGHNGLVPHLVCATCGEHNYLAGFDRPQPGGNFLAHCGRCNGERIHRRSRDVEASERLDLPQGGGRSVIERVAEPGSPRGVAGAQGGAQAGGRYGSGAAGFILRQVATSEELDGQVVERGVESLLGLGEEGLVASRIVLHDDVAPVVLVSGRVLLHGGRPEDIERVVARLRTTTPGKSGVLLLEELLLREPVSGSPQLLVELLEHKQKPMRSAAMRHLRGSVTPELLPLLARTLESPRTDTRLFALDLVQDLDDPAVLDLLFLHLDDRSSKVASRVIEALAGRPEERVNLELLRRALEGQWVLRDNAYALLAILEREDMLLEPILDDRHADPLLGGMRSPDLLVRGTCAAALAGIGFRSPRPLESGWLDREVTGTMVETISGKSFHSDFMAMQPRVLRRLRLLSGQDFGTDGPRWARWWVDHRVGFYAHRAYLDVAAGEESKIELHYRGTGRAAGAFSLFGADGRTPDGERRAGAAEKLFLTLRECHDLLQLLRREGLLGPERPPGQRGSLGPGQREVELVIDGRGKGFLFGKTRSEAWFERVVNAMEDLRHRNRWQRFPDRARYGDAREFWEQESGWWAGEHDERERGLRMKALIFESIRQLPPSERTLAMNELEDRYEVPGVAEEEDFTTFLDLLRDEGFFARRAQRLVALAQRSVQIGPEPGVPGSIAPEHADLLLGLLLARFERRAAATMGEIARACGPVYVRELAADERPLLRAVAASELAREPGPDDEAALLAMLEDPELVVEAAAVLALGQARVEGARTELLLRARLGQPPVRAAALEAIGNLGGEYVLEALVLGASDPDPMVKRGAARGLVFLRDPQSAPLLISLLRQGRESDIYETARDGLISLGLAASDDLLRVVGSPTHPARRECALLLAEMGDPRVVLALIQLVDERPEDAELAFELCVLSCVDARGEEDPAGRWASWFEGVTHDDSLTWLIAAMERQGIPVSPAADFRGTGPGAREAALLLLELLGSEEDYLVERARRELSRMLGADLGEIPRLEAERVGWLRALRDTILERFDA